MSQHGEVLVVDGDASIRSLLEAIVRMLPRPAVAAADGRSAIALLSTGSFEALVLDLLLPEISGFEVLRFVAERKPDLLARTIVLTTVPETQWRSSEEALGCAAVIPKPFSIDELQDALQSCCQGVPS